MSLKKKADVTLPSVEQVESELNKIKYRKRFVRTLINTLSVLIVVAAAAVLASTLLFPVVQVSGDSMKPTLNDGDILVTAKSNSVSYGDLCCVSWQNKMLLKRVIGKPGDVISIGNDGSVYVNDELIDEPYVIEKSIGKCDLTFPYEVPDNKYFILGDNRMLSVDSRNADIGCIGKEQIVGKVLFRIWPMNSTKGGTDSQ
ncbi:MAG TPA: signal peptidase I [Ruminococcus sp.]|nr:signal peptidase I [Ruminococcus sp.]HRU96060.1 signal peptidase I [Ruminococcus sp.]